LATFSVGDVSPLARVLPPSSSRPATNKGWPRWPTFSQAAQGDARQSGAAMIPVSEKHGLHWLAHLANFRVGDVSPLARVLPPPSPRPATNKGWPRWPTSPQAAQRGARQTIAAMTPVAEQHGLHWLAHLATFQCRRCFSAGSRLAASTAEVGHKQRLATLAHFPAGGTTRCKTKCYRNDSGFGEIGLNLINLVLSPASRAVLGAQRPRSDCPG
jgi:hypothetical protein